MPRALCITSIDTDSTWPVVVDCSVLTTSRYGAMDFSNPVFSSPTVPSRSRAMLSSTLPAFMLIRVWVQSAAAASTLPW